MGRVIAILIALGAALPARAEVIDVTDAPAYPALYAPDSAGGDRGLVLLDAALVEIAVALGAADRILARPAGIDLPGIEDTPHIVSDWAGVEGVVAMRPDLVVAGNVRFDTLREGLERIGIETALVNRTRPPAEKIRAMATLLGLEDRGEALIGAVEDDIAAARAVTIDGRPIRVLHASKQGAGGNFSAGGAGTGVDNLITRLDLVNAGAAVGIDRYRSVAPEAIVSMAPDVLLLSAAELPVFGDLDGFWQDYPGLTMTPAGQAQNLIIMRDLHVRGDAASAGIATLALARALAELDP